MRRFLFFLFVIFFTVKGSGQPPIIYCTVNFDFDIEPITYVQFASIDYTGPAGIDSVPALQDNTHIIAKVQKDSTYVITLKGNTGGPFEDFFTVFIDWNQNGTFDSSELYYIGSIIASSGVDYKTVSASITVPPVAINGITRMRIIKNYDEYIPNACLDGSYGQAQDFTILVGAGRLFNYLEGSYCRTLITGDIEPITKVQFGSIDNVTSEFVDSTPSTEVYTNLLAVVYPGDSLEMTVMGNTAGNYTNHFTALIDWNQDGKYGDRYSNEYVRLGSITNSTGTDSIFLKKYIHVPNDAVPGQTLLTILKNYSDVYYNVINFNLMNTSTNNITYGQAEEYTIVVSDPPPPVLPEISFAGITPITYTEFCSIESHQSETLDSSSLQVMNFAHLPGVALPGDTVVFSVKVNTMGNQTSYITAYFDWDQNGRYNDSSERYNLGTITNSTGTDAQVLTASVVIPGAALSGWTKVRVTTNANTYVPGAYQPSVHVGQASDYNVYVKRDNVCY